jgi:hypothetical protein
MSANLSSQLMKLINGFQVSQAICVAATLGVPDLLRHGPRRSDELASAANVHAVALYRLLRALAAVGVLEEHKDRYFALTALGDLLRSDVPSSKNAWARLMGQSNYWMAWQDLLGSVHTGETAFQRVHGMSVWDYRAQHSREAETFDRAMGTITEEIADAVLQVLEFNEFRTVVDVGGGEGAFLAKLLCAYPNLRGIVFDQPHVIAKAVPHINGTAGTRCEMVGGDFFKAVPAGADVYFLKWILHDWEDENAIAILCSCRRAMAASSRLILVEYLVAPPNEGADGKFMDLNMMVITGGLERTREDYARLLSASGFNLVETRDTAIHIGVLVAQPG